jgi:hypothetical protein
MVLLEMICGGAAFVEFGAEVGAGAEALAVCGEDTDADFRIFVESADRLEHVVEHGRIHGVQLLRLIEG